MASEERKAGGANTITFAVASVEVCTKEYGRRYMPEGEEDSKKEPVTMEELYRGFCSDNHLGGGLKNTSFECGHANHPVSIPPSSGIPHSMVNAAFGAYSYHYPLVLSVDDFAVCLAQGVAQHINKEPERHRSKLAANTKAGEKKNIEVDITHLKIQPKSGDNATVWPTVMDLITKALQKEMSRDLVALLTTPFSTTGKVEQMVLNCSMLDAAKAFYSYTCSVCCGIPSVTLHGSVADFESLATRIQALEVMFPDLKWWLDSLRPDVEQLMATAAGKPNLTWWNQMCHSVGGGSDISLLAGWLAHWIPYVKTVKGEVIRARRDYRHYTEGTLNGIPFGDFRHALTTTEFTLNYLGKVYPMQVIAGFTGVSQDSASFALRPVQGWMCLHRNPP